MSKITPCLWFDRNAREAVEFYTSVFEDSEVLETSHYADNAPMPAGTELTIRFRMRGKEFLALNGGPYFTFNEAVSFVVHCESQDEVDDYWGRLLEGGGTEQQCGWVKDRFGVSWQIVPVQVPRLMTDPDPAKRQRVMDALMTMVKIDIAGLEEAAA
jgi:predicted 3-demethylubiquinone-9 3-methyltransferase (glyoxalase superfamily)